jgi:hypothetical protein
LLASVAVAAVVCGCAPKAIDAHITERPLQPEDIDQTPQPAKDDDVLAALREEDSKRAAKNGRRAANDKGPKPEATDKMGDRPRDEEDEPDVGEPAAPVEPQPRLALPRQGPLSTVDSGRLDKSTAGGGSARAKAALALVREGRQLMAQGNLFLAEKRLEKALSLDASCGPAYLALAEVRYAQENWEQAAALSSKAALRLEQQTYFLSRAYLVGARSLINAERPEAAYSQVKKALAADPSNNEARLLKISLEAHLGITPDDSR